MAAAAGYAFAAWLSAGLMVYAGHSVRPRGLQVAFHCAAVATAFGGVFSLYFRGRERLPPAAAAGLAVGLAALLDGALLSPYFLHPLDVFLSFWDWQLPALLAAAAVYAAGRNKTFSGAS